MTKKKRGFMMAGAINLLVIAGFLLLVALGLLIVLKVMNTDFIVNTFRSMPNFQQVEDAGAIYYEYLDNGETVRVYQSDLEMAIAVTKMFLLFISVIFLGLSIASIVLSIMALVDLSKNKVSKGKTIALLILAILTDAYLTTAFMIVVLCLKDKPQVPQQLGIQMEQTIE